MIAHFTDMDGLIVVGDRPTWFKGFMIECGNVPKRKEYSVLLKLKLAARLEKTLLLCHDDLFALTDFDATLPNYYRGTCHEAIQLTKERRFKDMFAACLPNWMNFEIHCPMVIDTSRLQFEDRDFLLKTTYANRLKLPGTDIADCKLRGELNTTEIRKAIEGRPFFSTHDNATGDILRTLQELYPNKSVYEV